MEFFLPIAEVNVSLPFIFFLSLVVGILSGLFGVGGGFLMTPFLIFLGIPPAYAVPNEANNILGTSISGSTTHYLKGTLDYKMGLMIVVGGAIGGPFGAAIGGGLGSLAGGASPEQALINAGLSFAGAKFAGPAMDKFISGAPAAGSVGPTALKTVGSTLSGSGAGGVASLLPENIAKMGLGTAAATALAPVAGNLLSGALQPQEEASPNRLSVVDEYYAALARGENPPLPPELTPPPKESLIKGNDYAGLPSIEEVLFRYDPVRDRPMFARAATGGYIVGPGGPTDDLIPTLLSNTEFVMTGKAVAGADPTGSNNPDKGAKVMMGIMRAFEKDFDDNARMMA